MGEPTPTDPTTIQPLDEYARDRLKGLLGKELSRGARAATAGAFAFAMRHSIQLNESDHAYIAAGIHAAEVAAPVLAGIGLRRLGAWLVGKYPGNSMASGFQKFVSWLPL